MAPTNFLFHALILLLLSVPVCCCSGAIAPARGVGLGTTGAVQATVEGGVVRTWTETPAPTASLVPSPAPSRVPSLTPSPTSSPQPTSTPTATPTTTPTAAALADGTSLLDALEDPSADRHAPTYRYSVVRVYPHDPGAFTQGLVYDQGVLYEGTGLRGRSTLRRVELQTGEILQLHVLSDLYFGEGITLYEDELLQLTWKSNTGFVYDRDSFELLRTFHYPTEGWGLTHDGQQLIVSDGTSALHFLDPETLEKVGEVTVHDGDVPIGRLNELEYVLGEIYANVWQTDLIARIDPGTGAVTSWIDLTGLLASRGYTGTQTVDVLNGIAYDVQNDRLFVTGKLWPELFQIELIPPSQIFLPLAVGTAATAPRGRSDW